MKPECDYCNDDGYSECPECEGSGSVFLSGKLCPECWGECEVKCPKCSDED